MTPGNSLENDMLLGSFAARMPYGLLVIASPESTDPHVGWDAATESVHAVGDSIFVGVQQAASGLVKVDCYQGGVQEMKFDLLFAGQLSLPSSRLKFYDPDETIQMVLPVEGRFVNIELYSDDPDEPTELTVFVSATKGDGRRSCSGASLG
jgi:hypothetical protein